jgi:hypothetical protein
MITIKEDIHSTYCTPTLVVASIRFAGSTRNNALPQIARNSCITSTYISRGLID